MPILGRATLAQVSNMPGTRAEELGQGPQVMAVGPKLSSCQAHPMEVGWGAQGWGLQEGSLRLGVSKGES